MTTTSSSWPFQDVDRNDPLVDFRIAPTSLSEWSYLVTFDTQSPIRPTKSEALLLQSFLEEYKNHWYSKSYLARLHERPLDVDGGANGVTFRKYATDDWAYRRNSWQVGPRFLPGPPAFREANPQYFPEHYQTKLSLLQLLDAVHTDHTGEVSSRWLGWKCSQPLFNDSLLLADITVV